MKLVLRGDSGAKNGKGKGEIIRTMFAADEDGKPMGCSIGPIRAIRASGL